MNIQLYTPDVRVKLYKTIGRQTVDGQTPVSQRVLDTDRTIDLTPFIGEPGGLKVSKSVRESAGGFVLTFPDQPYVQGISLETLYALIEPMDFIEIRMRHNIPDATSDNPTTPPVYMRGFVSAISRNEAMGTDGKPMRTVTLNGQDFGKLWQIMQIKFMPGYVVGENYLSSFKLVERFGVGLVTTQTAADFVTQVVQKIINPFLSSLMPPNSTNPTSIKLDVSVANGVVDVGGAQNREGTVYSLLSYFGDVGVFNELYLEDREDGVYCVYRPTPFKDINGTVLQPDAPNLTPIDIDAKDVISLSVSRGDQGVANYYWVRAPRFELVDNITSQQFAVGADPSTVDLGQYANSAEQFYGLRMMETETQQGGNDVTTMASGQPAALQRNRSASMANWINYRRAILVAQNKDNVLFESGTARIRANETIKPGGYVRIVRGSFSTTFYVPSIDLDYVPYQGLFMTLKLERGNGFVSRVEAGTGLQAPYSAEMVR
ncbi:hypothetical protein R69619_00406 [Paraburkholderia nemoris]|uniref:hypothetical protein n=1 Tax=Paraburkholderia nemoris TaxID=2793076 RepID=UPI00190926BC|nr:hypothetical protein [Paraburkholderia nemoris]MBK3737670.1 hypothetical protein [Paraburkholderia aspalathi]CAE6694395.1 hypothetical protein R69619_00406 [Paraburkholderia nemoris]